MYKVFEGINIYSDDFYGPHDVWTERGAFPDFENAKAFVDQLVDGELAGSGFEGALLYRHHEEVGEVDLKHVEYGASLAFRPLPYGSKGFFVVKTP